MLGARSSAFAQTSNSNVTGVLVQGALVDDSAWDKVIPYLQAEGLRVVAALNPLSSLSDDVATTKRVIDAQTARWFWPGIKSISCSALACLAKLGIFGGRFETATHVHFLVDVFHMGTHRLGSNIQFVPDFLVDKTSGQQVQHFRSHGERFIDPVAGLPPK